MAEYRNPAQYGRQAFEWDPAAQFWSGGMESTAPGYLPMLLQYQDLVRSGQAKDYEAEQYRNWEQAARAIPTRDIATLTAGWQPQRDPEAFMEEGETQTRPGAAWWGKLDPLSPDVGPIVLQLKDKLDAGTATAQEQALYQGVMGMASDWDYRASVPQASDANPFGMGDQFMMALAALTSAVGGAGAFGAFAPVAAGAGAGAVGSGGNVLGSLGSTLGTIGQAAGYGSQAAGMLGSALDQDWLAQIGKALSVVGGLAGGASGIGGALSGGLESIGDVARLVSSTGRVTGALGTATGFDPLQQAARYLGYAGQLGRGVSGVQGLLGAASEASTQGTAAVPQATVQALSAPDMRTQRGGGMAEDWGYEQNWGASPTPYWEPDVGAYSTPDYMQSDAYKAFTGWGDPTGIGTSGDPTFAGEGSGNWLSTLGSLGSAALGFLGKNAGTLGPLASALGGLGAGAIGSNAARDASSAQANALNRGIDLQTAQWLQQQANLAPYLQAGQGGLAQLQQLAGRQAPNIPWDLTAVRGSDYALPGTTPGWQPQTYQAPQALGAGDYRWNPQQGPRAGDYRYAPGAIPQAANYRYAPGAVPTLSGQELLANDPGVAFRLAEGRNALEGSAAARGDLLSGGNLKALQARGQELASQEYGNAFSRASQQAQLREGWAQTASQMGWGQAEAESRLREQVNQVASQQGWNQATAEAVFREQQAQLASQQGWNQALQGQQNQFTQGLASAQWNQRQQQSYETDLYNRMMEQQKLRYGQDVTQNATEYDRLQQVYRQQLAQHLLPWEQQSVLASLGGNATSVYGTQGGQAVSGISNLLGQLGTTQAMGTLGSAGQWNQAIAGGVGGIQNILRGLNA